jgi:Mg-chelatase subunit ChlD
MSLRRRRQLALVLVALLAGPAMLRSDTAAGRLEFSDSVKMLDCDPAATAPCFRLKFNIVDADGKPLPAELPAPEKLAESIVVRVGDQPVTPFFAIASDKQTVRGRVALVLIDISGSMKHPLLTGETRFEAAKAGLQSFLDGFQDGIDRVAIVPFESHRVAATIRAAQFVSSKQEALRQVRDLPEPESHNNTGIYTAVSVGIDVLSEELKKQAGRAVSPESMVLLMTDGKNEVLKGDDEDLLDGPSGLQQASAKLRASGLQLIGVGFGDSGDVDETVLRQISTTAYMAKDAAELARVFKVARTLLSNRIRATFISPWADRASLAGRTLQISVRLKLANGQELLSNQITWATPQMGIPPFWGVCEKDEKDALYSRVPLTETGFMSVLRPVLVFLGLGCLLLILWFWIPRLVWSDQYIGAVPTKR